MQLRYYALALHWLRFVAVVQDRPKDVEVS